MDTPEKIIQCRKQLHDLNNKLNTISTYGSSLLLNKDISEDVLSYIRIMVNAALGAGDIIQDIYKDINEIT